MLVAVEAGSLLRGFILLLSLPLVIVSYLFISESLGIQILIFISFAGLKIRDIELASRAVLPRFYAADVRRESFEVFDRCKRKVVVTANPTVMVDVFVKDYLGGDKVLGTEIEVNPKTKKATGFVKKSGVLVGDLKRLAVVNESGDELSDIGLGDRKNDHDFMSTCKEGYMVPPSKSSKPVPLERLKSRLIFHDGRFVQRPDPLNATIIHLTTTNQPRSFRSVSLLPLANFALSHYQKFLILLLLVTASFFSSAHPHTVQYFLL